MSLIVYNNDNNITEEVLSNFRVRDKIFIPINLYPGTIVINDNDILTTYEGNVSYTISFESMKIIDINMAIYCKLTTLHSKLKLNYGSFRDEFPEQMMATRFIEANNKVLEIGGNIGRNSLIISSLLKDPSNLVVLECNQEIVKQLQENRDINELTFHIEPSALSLKRLIQKGWDTIVSDEDRDEFIEVPITTYENIKSKYNITFDILVADCEGALVQILTDFPTILQEINIIIIENDYWDYNIKLKQDNLLQDNFELIFIQCGGWGPCYACFYEVWKRK